MIIEHDNLKPVIHETAYVAESADIIGEVILHRNANIWFNAVLRADLAKIEIGEGSNIQDGAVCHVDFDKPVILGKNVTVGHNAVLHCCTVKDGALVGMGAIVLDGVEVGEQSLIGAGTVVTQNTKIPPKSLVLGSPARVIKTLSEEQIDKIRKNAELYIELANKQKGVANE